MGLSENTIYTRAGAEPLHIRLRRWLVPATFVAFALRGTVMLSLLGVAGHYLLSHGSGWWAWPPAVLAAYAAAATVGWLVHDHRLRTRRLPGPLFRLR